MITFVAFGEREGARYQRWTLFAYFILEYGATEPLRHPRWDYRPKPLVTR